MPLIRYFDSQIFDQESELAESEAMARGIYVRAFMNEQGKPSKAEVIRDHRITEVVYHCAGHELSPTLWEVHRHEYPGIPFQLTGTPAAAQHGQEQRKQRYDAEGTLAEIVIETLDERGELLIELRHGPDGTLTSRIEYEYDADGELARVREYDGQGRLLDEHDLRA